jgi:PmbA protein
MTIDLNQTAERALTMMMERGFDGAQVDISVSEQDELNMSHNAASLLRSTEDHSIRLKGLIDGRKATTSLTDLGEDSISGAIDDLFGRAQVAPQDDANLVSEGEKSDLVQGPQQGDPVLLANKVRELLEYRASETPKMNLEEGAAAYGLSRDLTLTSGGTVLSSSIGCYSLTAMGQAVEGDETSSFNYTGGLANDLSDAHAADYFGIGDMLKETEEQIHTQGLDGNFTGDVVLTPGAVTDLLGWFLGQLTDGQLISGSSLFKDRVGEVVASPLLNIRSRFDGAGQSPLSADGFVANPINLVEEGRLTTLLASLYGSRKTGVAHRPCGSGWQIVSGESSKEELISGVKKGALVARLSMGSPGPNGDFSGVIKNSFLIEKGVRGPALAEVMISGNVAQMLRDINGVSREHIDSGGEDLPWIRVPGLNFS